ncbi:hypothetical protein E2C01_092076 [Portunus trituberculatus]|uniref:Uncharacterized protein n=1 Tax=Portunus trituberculatus TaxID=210409 RepID=A0A5B7JUU6_PORTR|nr:hypothetical protein [Portunus trituberculatus]
MRTILTHPGAVGDYLEEPGGIHDDGPMASGDNALFSGCLKEFGSPTKSCAGVAGWALRRRHRASRGHSRTVCVVLTGVLIKLQYPSIITTSNITITTTTTTTTTATKRLHHQQ